MQKTIFTQKLTYRIDLTCIHVGFSVVATYVKDTTLHTEYKPNTDQKPRRRTSPIRKADWGKSAII
jgi:hypothetical protein